MTDRQPHTAQASAIISVLIIAFLALFFWAMDQRNDARAALGSKQDAEIGLHWARHRLISRIAQDFAAEHDLSRTFIDPCSWDDDKTARCTALVEGHVQSFTCDDSSCHFTECGKGK